MKGTFQPLLRKRVANTDDDAPTIAGSLGLHVEADGIAKPDGIPFTAEPFPERRFHQARQPPAFVHLATA